MKAQESLFIENLKKIEDNIALINQEISEWWLNYLHGHRNHYINVFSYIKNNFNDKILEIGSVPCHLTIALKLLGYDIIGVDINPERFNKLLTMYNLKIFKIDVEQEPLSFINNSFDVILFTEILEHLRINPINALREAYRVLKPGGRLILSTPNITPLHRIDFLFGKDFNANPVREFEKIEKIGHMGHFRLYSLREIELFLKYVGFKKIVHSFRGPLPKGLRNRIIMFFYIRKELFRNILFVIATKI